MREEPRKRFHWPLAIALLGPFILFVVVVTIMSVDLATKDPTTAQLVPNALQDKLVPPTQLPLLGATNSATTFDSSSLFGHVTLVNFWGSWCAPCRDEHPVLMKIKRRHEVAIVGINFKDNAENAQRFLNSFGNPFDVVAFDPLGRVAIDWGVYGPPETFLVNKKGIIIYKQIGPLTDKIFNEDFLPRINRALAESP